MIENLMEKKVNWVVIQHMVTDIIYNNSPFANAYNLVWQHFRNHFEMVRVEESFLLLHRKSDNSESNY